MQSIPSHQHAGIPRCGACGSSPYICTRRVTRDLFHAGHTSYDQDCTHCARGWCDMAVYEPSQKADDAPRDLACAVCRQPGVRAECSDCGNMVCFRCISTCNSCNENQCEECWSTHDGQCPGRRRAEWQVTRIAGEDPGMRETKQVTKKNVGDLVRDRQQKEKNGHERCWPDLELEEAADVVSRRISTSVARLAVAQYKLELANKSTILNQGEKLSTTTFDKMSSILGHPRNEDFKRLLNQHGGGQAVVNRSRSIRCSPCLVRRSAKQPRRATRLPDKVEDANGVSHYSGNSECVQH